MKLFLSKKILVLFVALVTTVGIITTIAFSFLKYQKQQKILNDPLSIEYLKAHDYKAGSMKTLETVLEEKSYKLYTVSYASDGLTIKGLLATPTAQKSKNGFPAILIAHGDVPTNTYKRTEKYVTQVKRFAENGFVVFMPDYRGHADSQGKATNAYAFPDYTIDTINALSSLQTHPDVDPEKIGIWSHSTGGFIALRAMVVDQRIKAGVFWGGVVGSFEELLDNWPTYWEYTGRQEPKPDPKNPQKDWRAFLVSKYGPRDKNLEEWRSISATSYLQYLAGPIQLHHSLSDEWVPVALSQILHKKITDIGKRSQLFTYKSDNHNLQANNDLAMQRTIEFFNRNLKTTH